MQLNGTFLNSKVARRIFTLFLLAALIPVVIFAFLSFQQVNQITTDNIIKNLRQDSKSLGIMLHERLDLIQHELKLYKHSVQNQPPVNSLYFKNIFVENTDIYTTTNSFYPSLKQYEIEFLKQGKPVLQIQQTTDAQTQISMIYPDPSSQTVIIGIIDPLYLWGDPDTYDLSKVFCVFGQANAPLFCSNQNFQTKLSQLAKHDELEDYFTSDWVLFLKPSYFYPTFNIVTAIDKQNALLTNQKVTQLFIPVSVLAIIIVALMSIIQIRRYLTPLEALMGGIKNVSKKNFQQTVDIKTDDEFKQLGDAFNTMSLQLSDQFDFLTTLSEIDQLMLNNLNEQDIINTATIHANNAVQSKTTHIALFNNNEPNALTLYQQDDHHIHGLSHQNVIVSDDDRDQFRQNKILVYRKHRDALPNYLSSDDESIKCHAIIPVIVNDLLKAVLIFNFQTADLETETQDRLRELGNRISIAFEKSEWEQKLYHNAHYDHLTGLPNRLLLNDRLQQSINLGHQSGAAFSVLFLDLDQFKAVNDSLGHAIGDKLLKTVANKLSSTLNSNITISRIGGDEFIILIPNQTDINQLYLDVTQVAEQLLSLLQQPLSIEGQNIHLSTSIGIANFPIDGETAESLMTNADSAMYHAKANGRNNFQFYTTELTEQARQKLTLKTELFDAFDKKQLQIHYQAKVCPQTQAVLGAEALLRWQHPEKGPISPLEFIPIAEETGLINKIGEWIIDECCRQNKQWQNEGLPAITISVNLSPVQFQQPDLTHTVKQLLSKHNLNPQYLELEIVESTAMSNTDETIKVLNELKQLNVKISIDDYGTGYSTLNYIKQFPVDSLKIDKCFIDHVVTDQGDQAIVKSTISLAHNIGLSVVAEGVEYNDQLQLLTDYGCDLIQGYYFSRPCSADQFQSLLAQSPLKL